MSVRPKVFVDTLGSYITKAKGCRFYPYKSHDVAEVLEYVLEELSVCSPHIDSAFVSTISVCLTCTNYHQEIVTEDRQSIIKVLSG